MEDRIQKIEYRSKMIGNCKLEIGKLKMLLRTTGRRKKKLEIEKRKKTEYRSKMIGNCKL